ncbi:glycosyltransferase [Zobellia uliginosa]|uniref:glycosyltransferase n=1 Tax=Zobellia uliginosa TaxID=143224 RepID=UPI001C07C1A4|nr:glycosyltransferase [Zobellia uliginosa]MBU2947837.1 glycosyltransferase [Zobellia uliginosa]
MKKLKILISAYACGPNSGSEPGMGWNFVTGISKHHELHVIVEKRKWEKPILDYLNENPTFNNNINFHFIEKQRNKKLRKIWPPSYYWFYRKWQKKALALGIELNNKENFDIIHHLNMVGYREPGYLWKINKPFVWGPIGALENSPWSFLPSLGIQGMAYYASRNLLNSWQQNFKNRLKKVVETKNSRLIAATPQDAIKIRRLWGKDAVIICEVGQEKKQPLHLVRRKKDSPLAIVWSGQHTAGKNLSLLLKSLKNISIPYELHILGKGPMTEAWIKMAQKLEVDKNCIWHGWVDRVKALNVMKMGHVFCITSIKDLTASVTLEALSNGLPIVCLNHMGFAHVVNEKCGIKIPVDNPKNAQRNIALALTNLYQDEEYRYQLSHGAIERAADFKWENKIQKINDIYSSVTNP